MVSNVSTTFSIRLSAIGREKIRCWDAKLPSVLVAMSHCGEMTLPVDVTDATLSLEQVTTDVLVFASKILSVDGNEMGPGDVEIIIDTNLLALMYERGSGS